MSDEMDALRRDVARLKHEAMRAQRDDLIGTLAAIARHLGIEDWTALAEDPSLVIGDRARLIDALTRLRAHDSAGGPCDAPGARCDCYARADAALAAARGAL